MKTVVWNMASKSSNWDALRESPELLDADISLVCEATPPPSGVESVGEGATVGLEAPLLPDKPVKRPWSTAVVSPHRLVGITDARVDRSYGEPLPFEPSRPGSWTAATVEIGEVTITAISLYGLLDEKSDASVHRSLSELSPIFDHEDYRKRLLLGGDLNILAGQPKGERPNRSQVVLERIAAYGLVDCLEQARQPGALGGCKCDLGADCTHTWTKFEPKRPTTPYQDDYLFASRWLASRLEGCEAPSPKDWYDRSDHAPIVATFAL